MKLVIVESPAKAKTIGKFLGKEYDVVASYGHIRDLPSSADEIPEEIKNKPWARMAVDVDNDFMPVYVIQKESKKRIAELRKKLKDADEIVLATDEDREGESISWHLLETLKPKIPISRIVFHEITKSAIVEAIRNPRQVDGQLVRAQESRRILDRLYGYSLSPVLWKKVRTKLSAGRVQSVAVRLVVEREEARRAFRRAAYWDVEATLKAQGKSFPAHLITLGGKDIAEGKHFDSATGELKQDAKVVWLQGPDAQRVASALEDGLPWRIRSVAQKETTQRPGPPFITSTLQQAASSALGYAPNRTMKIAQRLYEGVDLGGGEREGLITYMRTDSVVLSEKALQEAQEAITHLYGAEYHSGPRRYQTKSKMAQEAHEAIRPTVLSRKPEEVAAYVSDEELRLYKLIWSRTLSSQMADAKLLKTVVDFEANATGEIAVLRANGSVITFDGFLRVSDSGQRDNELPPVHEGQQVLQANSASAGALTLEKLEPKKHETQPPARFTEASLVRQLEEEGIGRPSTYAPTIAVIQQREYVMKKGSALAPTFIGIAVTLLLRKHFAEYVDLKFTARMEDALDEIAQGQEDWIKFLSTFYRGDGKFGPGLEGKIAQEMPGIEFPQMEVGSDPESGAPIVVRLGRNAAFLQRGEGGPGNTTTLPLDITYEELTVEKALELLEAKARGEEGLGADPETGQRIYALLGPYGPYVQLGEVGETEKPKRASLPKGTPMDSVTLALALRYLSLPRDLGPYPETGHKITAAIGRFGPFVHCHGEYRSLDKTDDVFTITPERALELLSQPKRSQRTKTLLATLGEHPDSKKRVEVYEGKYGPYVTDGEWNATVPKEEDATKITLQRGLVLLEEAAMKGGKKSKRKPVARKAAAKKKPATKLVVKKPAAKRKAADSGK